MYVTRGNGNTRYANMQNGGHTFVRRHGTPSTVHVDSTGFRACFYESLSLSLSIFLAFPHCIRACVCVLNTCTHYRLRGRYGFYERRRASEGGRSDAFDTIYKRRDAESTGVEKGEEGAEAGGQWRAREVTK